MVYGIKDKLVHQAMAWKQIAQQIPEIEERISSKMHIFKD